MNERMCGVLTTSRKVVLILINQNIEDAKLWLRLQLWYELLSIIINYCREMIVVP